MKEDLPDSQQSNISRPKPVVLLLLDGWGIAPASEVNAITTAQPKNFLNLVKDYPVALLYSKSRDPRRRYFSIGTGLSAQSENYPLTQTCFSQVIAQANLRQLKISSAHNFTYLNLWLNGGQEESFNYEERLLIGQTDDDFLEVNDQLMSAGLKAISSDQYDFIVLGLSAADQASSLGDWSLTVKSIKSIDRYLLKLSRLIIKKKAALIIASPFGNAERTKDIAADWPDKEPTGNPVPVVLVADEFKGKTIGLADTLDNDLSLLAPTDNLTCLAPTILDLMNLDKNAFNGESLI